jgi:hypothetical protein
MSPKIYFKHPLSNGGVLTFSALVVATRLRDRAPIVRIPSRVRSIPFPPFEGRAIVQLKPEFAQRVVELR